MRISTDFYHPRLGAIITARRFVDAIPKTVVGILTGECWPQNRVGILTG